MAASSKNPPSKETTHAYNICFVQAVVTEINFQKRGSITLCKHDE